MSHDTMDPRVRREVVAFLRSWLPAESIRRYREMIAADPDGWHRHPHFAGGIIVQQALRGNGITESKLGIRSLDAVWPSLLQAALAAEEEHTSSAQRAS